MRALLRPILAAPLLGGLLLAGCGAIDSSPGASGFPDISIGTPGFSRGEMRTDGTITLDREVPIRPIRVN
jgi:hypothetical protein